MSRTLYKTSLRALRRRDPLSKPNGSSIDSHDSGSVSAYNDESSETSLETESPPLDPEQMPRYSVENPVAAGVFDSSASITNFTPPSLSRPRQYAHHLAIDQDRVFQSYCPLRRKWNRNTSDAPSCRSTMYSKSFHPSKRQQRFDTKENNADRAIGRWKLKQLDCRRSASPTLSVAEHELEQQLISWSIDVGDSAEDRRLWVDEEIQNTPIELVGRWPKRPDAMDYSSFMPPPAVPIKSSRRNITPDETPLMSQGLRDHTVSRLDKGRSGRIRQRFKITIPRYRHKEEKTGSLSTEVLSTSNRRIITPTSAENVILHIYRSLDSFDDLFATAVVNQGFYRVFKRHELDLIRSTLRKMSPPAWEYREIAYPGHDMLHDDDLEMTRPQEEYTPSSYLQLHKRDMHVMRSIKALIHNKCQSLIRPEMAAALMSIDAGETGRVDDALWRIWTFCKIFGSGKSREDDLVAQQDWLKGGPMVHQQICTFSITSTDYMNDTLISAPECFAKGNANGLSGEQLFDMMELWGCLEVLLHEFSDDTALRTAQARECGVYHGTDVRGGDIDGEESMLEEWCSYILTFGLSAVFDLVSYSQSETVNPFMSAAQHGWMNWAPPVSGSSRRYFLKEAASRVYEEKIACTFAANSTRTLHRELSKERSQDHRIELRKRRVEVADAPGIRFSQERPMRPIRHWLKGSLPLL
ncbi:hypothetical protein ACEQ8H_003924 [Pleosporales sp. CAS-2024a]